MCRLLPLLLVATLALADGLSEDQKAELNKLLDMLGNEEWEVRERATLSLRRALASGQPVVEYVAERMKSPDVEVRDRVKKLLLETGHWDASPELLAQKAQAFVQECDGREMATWYAKTSPEPTAVMTEENLSTLSVLLRSPKGLDVLLAPFADKSEIYRRNVCFIVAANRPAGAAKFLLHAGEDKDEVVRAYAAYGWGRLGDAAYLGSLLVLAKDKSPLVRMATAIALAKVPDAGDIPLLLFLLDDEDAMVRYHASYTLERMTGEDFGYNAWHPPARRAAEVARWTEWWKANGEKWKPR